MSFDQEAFEAECDELRIQAQFERRYQRELLRHPDPRDPEYPGDDGDCEGGDE